MPWKYLQKRGGAPSRRWGGGGDWSIGLWILSILTRLNNGIFLNFLLPTDVGAFTAFVMNIALQINVLRQHGTRNMYPICHIRRYATTDAIKISNQFLNPYFYFPFFYLAHQSNGIHDSDGENWIIFRLPPHIHETFVWNFLDFRYRSKIKESSDGSIANDWLLTATQVCPSQRPIKYDSLLSVVNIVYNLNVYFQENL